MDKRDWSPYMDDPTQRREERIRKAYQALDFLAGEKLPSVEVQQAKEIGHLQGKLEMTEGILHERDRTISNLKDTLSLRDNDLEIAKRKVDDRQRDLDSWYEEAQKYRRLYDNLKAKRTKKK